MRQLPPSSQSVNRPYNVNASVLCPVLFRRDPYLIWRNIALTSILAFLFLPLFLHNQLCKAPPLFSANTAGENCSFSGRNYFLHQTRQTDRTSSHSSRSTDRLKDKNADRMTERVQIQPLFVRWKKTELHKICTNKNRKRWESTSNIKKSLTLQSTFEKETTAFETWIPLHFLGRVTFSWLFIRILRSWNPKHIRSLFLSNSFFHFRGSMELGWFSLLF